MKKISDIGEFGFIDLIKKQIGSSSIIKGIGDDTAVVNFSADKYLLLTTDMLVEGVHFTRAMSAKAIGHKAIGCNISDIAAMGGLPKYAVVSIGLSGNLSIKFATDIYAGMNQLAKKFGVVIVGGDTVKSSKLIINVALTGEVKKDKVVLRSGAKKGDQIFVTGALGKSFSSGRHLTFTPRLLPSQYLVKHFKPTAMIDISDGLAADLGHVLEESNVGAIIDEKCIPRHQGASFNNALHDGEDFELLFTLSRAQAQRLKSKKDFKFYHIGEITSDKNKLRLIDKFGQSRILGQKGFVHF